jgi:hypothetical protein
MRWTHLAAALIVACGATACLAETPQISSNRPQAMPLIQGGRLFGGPGWWSRYGEPVNSAALAQASPSDKVVENGPMPMHGGDYVYGPDACDCPPPCIDQLWTGYYQNPKRCNPGHHLFNRHCGHGNGCGACGNGCGSFAKLFGKDCCSTCDSRKSCGCTTPVTCTTAAPDCGCKPVCGKCRHFHRGLRGCMAHWNCNSCSTPLGCGCTTAVPSPMQAPSEKQAAIGPPKPLPEEAILYSLPRLN